MATSNTINDGVLFGGVEWSSSPVTFHRNKGRNVELTERNTVATRVRHHNYGIVFTSEPLLVGQMLKFTVTERGEDPSYMEHQLERWTGGMVRLVCT